MSDRPDSDPTTEGLRFLQHRVAQFGKVAGLAGLAFWVFNVVGLLSDGGSATVYGHGWALTSWGPHPSSRSGRSAGVDPARADSSRPSKAWV